MDYLAASRRNPFDMSPPCESVVPGYGDTRADFHVVGDHPGVHGGESTRLPFTGKPWSAAFFEALDRAGLTDGRPRDGELAPGRTFFSYLYACVPDEGLPGPEEYAALEPFFDAELRAITAHVLLPVGDRALKHVLGSYTSLTRNGSLSAAASHGEELRGAGWLVVPVKEPAEWTSDDADLLVERLRELLASDYRQTSDLGRFMPDDTAYFVR